MTTRKGGKEVSDPSIIASIIVPSYKEAGNVKALVERVFAAFDKTKSGIKRENVELIYVDDNSRDGTEEAVNALAAKGYAVRIIVRTKERGLSSAVLRGFEEARGKLLLCMDGDLQHPPESVPELLESLNKDGVEFVIGTRYGEGVAIDKSWPLHRRIISVGARLLSRPLSPLSDPMTGFFGVRKDVYNRGKQKISPIGFKICLETYVKCGVKKSAEVPFSFGVRTVGESKLTGTVIIRYLQQLAELYRYQPLFPILLFIAFIFIIFVVVYYFKTLL